MDEFRTHLRLYRGLFLRLKEVRMVFIHQDSFHVPAAETCFRAALKAPEKNPILRVPDFFVTSN